MSNPRIFIVEDEGIVAADIEDQLKRLGYEVAGQAASAEDALERIRQTRPDLVLMDIILRGKLDGVEAARLIAEQNDIPVVFLTSHGDPSTFRWASHTGPFGYVLKPFDERELRITIEMALQRHTAEQRLRQMERWLATTLKSIGDAVITTDMSGQITFMNPIAQKLTGWTDTEAIGRSCMAVFRAVEAKSGQPIPSPVQRAMQEGAVVQLDSPILLRTRSGSEIPIDDSAAPIRDDKGAVTDAVLVFRDCTERLRVEAEVRALNEQLEQRVRTRTAELDAANKQLESFSYSVAHDLRAPLRAIQRFAGLLAEHHAKANDAEAQRCIGIVSENAERMGQMVDHFLHLARISRMALRMRPIAMPDLVQSILAELELPSRHPNVQVELHALPDAEGDEGLLRQVWINLLSNALKFTKKNPKPHIEISGRTEHGHTRYSIRDNGVGFDPQQAEKLFLTFQRLHSSDDFDGTGVGLSIVQRIVQQHTGRVWAEGEVGRGATFHFSLPSGEREPSHGKTT